MKVRLISATRDAERLVAMAARSTHTLKFPDHISDVEQIAIISNALEMGIYTKSQKTIMDYLPKNEREYGKRIHDNEATSMVEKINALGHTSVFEHASFTFSIEGVSRACTHQLVRHRIASYSQQSQRYVEIKDWKFVVPQSIEGNAEAKQCVDEFNIHVRNIYIKLRELGIEPQDARYMLPNSMTTNIVVTMNARALLNFFELRTCLKAQWEIRQMAILMLKEVRKKAPNIFQNAGPQCRKLGYCPERDDNCTMNPRHMRGGKKIKIEKDTSQQIQEVANHNVPSNE
ncbi:MAG: FAD-dependent thymidylate synthase [Methanobacteriota archaeon]